MVNCITNVTLDPVLFLNVVEVRICLWWLTARSPTSCAWSVFVFSLKRAWKKWAPEELERGFPASNWTPSLFQLNAGKLQRILLPATNSFHFRCSWSTSALIILGLDFIVFFLVMLDFPFPNLKLFTIVNSFLSWTYIQFLISILEFWIVKGFCRKFVFI